MKLLKIFILILLTTFLISILFYSIVEAEDRNTINYFINIAEDYNKEFAEWNGIKDMNEKQAGDRVFYLKYYSTKFETDIHPHRLWKDAFFIVLHETRFVNYKSLDQGKSLGWISMRKTTIDMLNKIYGFKEVPDYEIINSDKLQAKYIISFLAWLNNKGDRLLSIIRYNKGQNYNSFTGNENYYKKVVELIRRYES
ncbi:MAG: hypothetical protein ACQEQF_00060 [Bacillota bacterium]